MDDATISHWNFIQCKKDFRIVILDFHEGSQFSFAGIFIKNRSADLIVVNFLSFCGHKIHFFLASSASMDDISAFLQFQENNIFKNSSQIAKLVPTQEITQAKITKIVFLLSFKDSFSFQPELPIKL